MVALFFPGGFAVFSQALLRDHDGSTGYLLWWLMSLLLRHKTLLRALLHSTIRGSSIVYQDLSCLWWLSWIAHLASFTADSTFPLEFGWYGDKVTWWNSLHSVASLKDFLLAISTGVPLMQTRLSRIPCHTTGFMNVGIPWEYMTGQREGRQTRTMFLLKKPQMFVVALSYSYQKIGILQVYIDH